jgi:hypothetical protein
MPQRKSCGISQGFLGVIRPHRRDEPWSASLWQTFFATCVGTNIPALGELIIIGLVIMLAPALVAKSLPVMFLVIMLAPVLPIPGPKRLMIGQ